MAKIFRTEKLSLNGDNIRIRSEGKGEFEITDSDNNVLISRATIESDISSLATQSSLESGRRDSDVSSLAATIGTNDSDLSSLAATDVTHASDISSLAASSSGSTEALDSDVSSLATASSLEAVRRDSDVSSLAATIGTNDSDLSSLAATDVTHASDISSLAASSSGSTEALDSDVSSLATASSLEAVRRDSDVSSLAATIGTNDSDLSSLAATDVTHASDISSLAASSSGSTEALDSDVSSLATASSLTVKELDSDVSSLAALITTNDIYATGIALSNQDTYANVDYTSLAYTKAPAVVGTLMGNDVDAPIIGVQLSGVTTSTATFIFSDEIPGDDIYTLEVLVSPIV